MTNSNRQLIILALAPVIAFILFAAKTRAEPGKIDPGSFTTLDISRPFDAMPALSPRSTPADTAAGIQGRLDYLLARNLSGRIYLPAGHWQISRPIFMNGDNKEVVGAGVGQSFLEAADGYRAMPMLNAGSRTAVEHRPLQACNRVRLTDPKNAVLDASVVGERFGLRTYGEYPSDHFPGVAHRPVIKEPKPWAKGTDYKTNDAIDLQLTASAGRALAICTADHAASEANQPGKGADWKSFWVIQVPAHVLFVGDPLANGAYDPAVQRAGDWAAMDHFTLDFAYTQNVEPGIYTDRQMLCGAIMGNPDRASHQVWKLVLQPNGDLLFDLTLADGSAKSIVIARGCTAVGTYRLAVQVDFPSHTLAAWLGKPAKPALVRTCNDAKTLPPSSHFRPMEYGFFSIAGGDDSPSCGNGRAMPPTDITVCGLHTSAVLRYADDEKLTSRSSATVDDNFRYFTNDAGTLALLPLTDNPAETESQTARLLVTVQHGSAAGDAGQKGFGYLKVPQQIFGMGRPRISDITITPGPVWGAGILTWHTLDMQLTSVDVRGGFYAVGDLFYGAQYTFFLRNCLLSGSEAAFNGSSNIIYMRDVRIDPVGRYGILLSGSNIQIENVTFGDPQKHKSEYYFRHVASVDYGGMNLLDNVRALAPSGCKFPSKAAFSQETISYSRTSLVMRNCAVANMGPNAAFVDLPFVAFPAPATLLLENNTYTGGPISSWVKCGSPWWSGQVRGFDAHAPMAKYFDWTTPTFSPWKAGNKYRIHDHVQYVGRAWECTAEHSATAGQSPDTDAGRAFWNESLSRIVFEP